MLRICERDVEVIKQPHGSRPRAGLLVVPVRCVREEAGGVRGETGEAVVRSVTSYEAVGRQRSVGCDACDR